MNTHPDILQTLEDTFGFAAFLPGQEEIICRLLDSQSCLAIFPTGQGKSLCYQLSALHLPGLTLVVSPLVALMKDQVDVLQKRKVAAVRLDSSLSHEEYRTVQMELAADRIKLLYVAPERFANERFLTLLKRLPISQMVIDEAHCISEWGHNFRPDYLKLTRIRTELAIPVCLCLTATATPKVADDIQQAFVIAPDNFIQTGFYRPNLTLRFSPSADPLPRLIKRLNERPPGATIVYVTLQATAEKVASALEEAGFAARTYHAGLKDAARSEIQEWFMASEQAIVVATIAFGMGIDKADIRYIYHYNLPKSLENYSQEIGRAGRDGQRSLCEMLGGGQDLIVLENFSYGDTPEPAAIRDLTMMILAEKERFSLSVYELSSRFDMRPLVITTLLTYLELARIIESTGPFYSGYQFIPLKSSAEIFVRFDEERVDFLRRLFSCAVKGRKWFKLDMDEVLEKLEAPRQRVVAALNYLEEQGDLQLKVSGARRGYRMLNRPQEDEQTTLLKQLEEKFIVREQNDIRRLQQVVSFITHQGCQTGFLLAYFGERLEEECCHCEFCLSGRSACPADAFSRHTTPAFPDPTVERIRTTLAENHGALRTLRQQTRFFCGLTSPAARRAGLCNHPAFGLLADTPFTVVQDRLQEPGQ